ncbi:MAG: TetR/AcrR family transcriptional regulator [Eubacterium sp.]|nr:TetR/AcrR family transcriptional regulator [Eubacterium sp.]
MGRVEIKKKNKEEALYQKGFQLFVDKGFVKTTIADIAKAAGLAKGTFYLYFKDKYELRDKLIARHSGQVLRAARAHLAENPVEGFENQILVIVDYILEYLQKNTMVLRFINKNLSWGIFAEAMSSSAPEETQEVYSALLEMMEREHVSCERPELLLFTIFELVGSTGYSCILNEQPVTMKEYLPYLHTCILRTIDVFTGPEQKQEV